MKYPAIAAALGWTENNDIEDGIFFQPEELRALDQKLSAVKTEAAVKPVQVTEPAAVKNVTDKKYLTVYDDAVNNTSDATAKNVTDSKYRTSFDEAYGN